MQERFSRGKEGQLWQQRVYNFPSSWLSQTFDDKLIARTFKRCHKHLLCAPNVSNNMVITSSFHQKVGGPTMTENHTKGATSAHKGSAYPSYENERTMSICKKNIVL